MTKAPLPRGVGQLTDKARLGGRVRYQLKTPWRNGTTHVEFEPIEFIAKLAALVPPPRAHLTRFHGVFAPNANLRAQLTPSGRGRRPATDAQFDRASSDDRTSDERRRAMTWAQRLKRVCGIDVNTCVHCGGAVRIVASIKDPTAIRAILSHFEKHGALEQAHYRPAGRRSARCREPVGNGHGRRRCAAPRSRNPSHRGPIRAPTGACVAPACPIDRPKMAFGFPILGKMAWRCAMATPHDHFAPEATVLAVS